MKLEKKTLQELKEKKISIKDLYDDHFIDFRNAIEVENVLKLLNENICSFEEIVDMIKSISDREADSYLYALLNNKKLFDELIQNNRLNTDDLRYLLNKIDKEYELDSLCRNTTLSKCIVDNELFQELIDKFKSIKNRENAPRLYKLLKKEKLFEKLIKNNKLNKEDLEYLLNRIDNKLELEDLCDNTPLIKKILNEFVLDKELVDKLNTIFENVDWHRIRNIHTLFEYIECRNKNNEEILKLIELNRIIYRFDEDQRLELIELIQNSEIAKNRLNYIVENNLESQFDFDSLIIYLKKSEKKNILNI